MKLLNFALIAGLVAAAAPLGAQRAAKDSAKKSQPIPADARPPKGMCRIWLENVPAGQQPAATDCQTAIKNRPQNAQVIFGDDYADSSKKVKADTADHVKMPPNVKGFTQIKTVLPLPKRPPEG